MADEPPSSGGGISLNCYKLFLYMLFSVYPKIFFQEVSFSAIQNYVKFTFLSDVCTHLQL